MCVCVCVSRGEQQDDNVWIEATNFDDRTPAAIEGLSAADGRRKKYTSRVTSLHDSGFICVSLHIKTPTVKQAREDMTHEYFI